MIITTHTIIRSWKHADWYLAIHASSPGSGPGRYARLSLTIYPYYHKFLVKLDVSTTNIDINYHYEIVLLLYHFYLAGFLVHIYKISKKIPQPTWLSVILPVRGSALPDDFKRKRGCWVVGRLVGVVYRPIVLLLHLLPGGLDVKLLQLLSLVSPALCRWGSLLWGLRLRRVSSFPFFLVAFCFVAIFRFYVNCRY